jgi:hypothetical protein
MANPVRVDRTKTPNAIRVMTDAEMDYAAHKILEAHYNNVTTLQVNGSVGTRINIGTLDDVDYVNAAGSSDLTTATTSFDFLENRDSISESFEQPLHWDGSKLERQNDTELNSSLITHALTRYVADGLGSYHLAPTAPTVGGTWVEVTSLTDELAASLSDTGTKLWRRTTQTTPTEFRPLKTQLNGNTYEVVEFTDAELEALHTRFHNQRVSTGVGTWALQATAPGTGTWVRMGTEHTDDKAGTTTGSFTGFFSQSYLGPNFAGPTFLGPAFTQAYSRNFSRGFSRNFSRQVYYRRFFAGNPGPNYNRVKSYTRSFTGFYTGFFVGSFQAGYTANYQASFSGPAFSQIYNNTVIDGDAANKVGVANFSLWIRSA